MRIRTLHSFVLPGMRFVAGRSYELDSRLAQRLVRDGLATLEALARSAEKAGGVQPRSRRQTKRKKKGAAP